MRTLWKHRLPALLAAVALLAALLTACKSPDNPASDTSITSTDSEVNSGMTEDITTSGSENTGTEGTDPTQSGTASGGTTNNPGSNPGSSATDAPTTPTTVVTDPSRREEILADIAFYQEIVDIETEWLASMQLDNGAMPMTIVKDGSVKVNPYFADFAILAILDGDKKFHPTVKKYMDWHFSHLNTASTDYNGVDGTIYDYTVTVSGGKVTNETPTLDDKGQKLYDSTDSYAATFLNVLWKYYEKSGDAAYIRQHAAEIDRIVSAMFSTMHNGLTMAKPDYPVKYLMDNCEVYEGIVDGISLYETILVPAGKGAATLTKLKTSRDQVSKAIEDQLWNAKGYYEAGIFKNGDLAYAFDWDMFYPCATAQVFPILSGVVAPGSARAKTLYDNFNKHYSTGESKHTWEKISIPDSFYWGALVQAGAMMGDEVRVKSYMTLYRKLMNKHAYPLYNADAGKACMAAAIMVQNLTAQLG